MIWRPHRMTEYRGRTVFRSTRWMIGAVAVSAALFIAGTWFFANREGASLKTGIFAVLALVGVLGVLETVGRRIVLTDDSLRVLGLWGNGEYRRADIVRVSYEKASPVVLHLADGRHVKLPDLGISTQSITNSIRAWAKQRG